MLKTYYTDGSVKQKSGGWAVVSGKDSWSGKVDTDDAYNAELEAIAQVFEMAEGDFSVVSDHWGIVKEIREMLDNPDWQHPLKAARIWERIESNKDKAVGVEWMKRCTTAEQRLADMLARECAESGICKSK